MSKSTVLLGVIAPVVLIVAACGKDEPPPASPQPMTGQPCQPGMPCNNAPAPTYAPTATNPTPGQPVPGQMSTPGPTALPCQNDSACMTHRCNMQFQKCAFPCNSEADCIQGSTCIGAGQPLAFCAPKPPGQ
jgi:hypothetical protein